MHPYFVEHFGHEHMNDLMREAEHCRLAHPGTPKAHRRAKWWPMRRRARAGCSNEVLVVIQATALSTNHEQGTAVTLEPACPELATLVVQPVGPPPVNLTSPGPPGDGLSG